MTQPLFEHRLELGGYETRVLELEGRGPAVLFLHGFADSADTWRLQLDLLAREGRRAIAVDLPGFATAAPMGDGRILPQLVDFAGAAVDYATTADVRKVVVVGNSLGGCVALKLAEHPDLPIAGVVPVAPAGLDMPFWFAAIERDPTLRALLAVPVPLPEVVVREAVAQVYRRVAFHQPNEIDKGVIAQFTWHLRSRSRVAQAMSMARRMLPELRHPFTLENVTYPTMLVWGTKDRLVFSSGAQRVLDSLPDTRVELIEGCGHCPQLESPGVLADLLADFPVGAIARKAA